MKRMLLLALAAAALNGCLVVEKIAYSITMSTDTTGTVDVTFYDIRSDEIGNKKFEEDKATLFTYALSSQEFAQGMQEEGKFLTRRELLIAGEQLNGKAQYTFNNIRKVEGIKFDGGYYYLTMQTEDSILTTNGEVVSSEGYKRILWEAGTKELRFEIQSAQDGRKTRGLAAPYLEWQKQQGKQ